MTICCFDFESEAIDTRPNYPPIPVGLAIFIANTEPYYMAWGHPIDNNCTREYAVAKLQSILANNELKFIAHNLPFDASIMEEKLGLKFPWERSGDTMLLAFLHDPFGELSLKPLSDKLLGMPPEEQDAIREWLVSHGVCRANDKAWGAHIAKAPGGLVGTYAIGDVIRTYRLYEFFMANGADKTDPVVNNKVDTSKIGDGGAPW